MIVIPPGYETGSHYHERQQELYFIHRGAVEVEFGRDGLLPEGEEKPRGPGLPDGPARS